MAGTSGSRATARFASKVDSGCVATLGKAVTWNVVCFEPLVKESAFIRPISGFAGKEQTNGIPGN